MKRFSITVAALAIALAMVSVVASGQKRSRANNQARQQVGKVLVKKLPADLLGVRLSGNRVRVKAGYKFVKQADGSVTVARIKAGGGGGGGAGLSGKWSCDCDLPGTGSCDTVTSGNLLSCAKGKCSSSCTLLVTTTGGNLGVIMY